MAPNGGPMKHIRGRAPAPPASVARHATRLTARDPMSSCGGVPLDGALKTTFESAFRTDLSGVRVHADGPAGRSASALGAAAYTVGNEIFFGHDRYRPDTVRGTRLLVHELAHVVQQRRADATDEGVTLSDTAGRAEREASHAADAFVRGSVPRVSLRTEPIALYCQKDGDEPRVPVLENLNQIWDMVVAKNIVRPGTSPGDDRWELTIGDPIQLTVAIAGVARELGVLPSLVVTSMEAMFSASRGSSTASPGANPSPLQAENAQAGGAKKPDNKTEFSPYTDIGIPYGPYTINRQPGSTGSSAGFLSTSIAADAASANVGAKVSRDFWSRENAKVGGNLYGGTNVDAQGVTPVAGGGIEFSGETKGKKGNLTTELSADANVQFGNQKAASLQQWGDQQNADVGVTGDINYEPRPGVNVDAEVSVTKPLDKGSIDLAGHIGAKISVDTLVKMVKNLIRFIKRRGRPSHDVQF